MEIEKWPKADDSPLRLGRPRGLFNVPRRSINFVVNHIASSYRKQFFNEKKNQDRLKAV